MTDATTEVSLVNLIATTRRVVIVPGGAYGEHRIEKVIVNGRETKVGGPHVSVTIEPGAGARISLVMKRYALPPTFKSPI